MADVNFVKRFAGPVRRETNIYQLAAVRVSERSVLAAAQPFGLAADPARFSVTRFATHFVLRDGTEELSVSAASGALRRVDTTLWQRDDGQSSLDITDEDAVKIARKYLQLTGLAPLSEVGVLRVTRLRVGTMERGARRAEERVIDAAVVFQRLIDRVPVEGPGGKVVVYIDAQRRVSGAQKVWREIASVKKAVPASKLIAPSAAEEHLRRYWREAWDGKLDVTDARFGYFESGPGEAQKVLQPAYIMPLTLTSPDGRFVMKSVHVVAAAADAIGTLMPPPKAVVPQPRRRG